MRILSLQIIIKNREIKKVAKIIKTKEPEIDDIFDVINQTKDKCGEIRMAME